MNIVRGVLLVLVTGKVAYAVDPSACQRFIKFMLIDSCGATKRESQQLPLYRVMSNDGIDMRYFEMVKDNMIRGVELSNFIEEGGQHFSESESKENPDVRHDAIDQIYYSRFKRGFFDVQIMKPYAERVPHERIGSFHFIGRLPVNVRSLPAPRELKSKCCGDGVLCTSDDFKGFCG